MKTVVFFEKKIKLFQETMNNNCHGPVADPRKTDRQESVNIANIPNMKFTVQEEINK